MKNKPPASPAIATSPAIAASRRWLLGGIGALMPIVIAALSADFTTFFENPKTSVVMGWGIRSILLFIIGGFVVYLHRNLQDDWQCFVTGIAAPALITTAFAGKAGIYDPLQRVDPAAPTDASLLVPDAPQPPWFVEAARTFELASNPVHDQWLKKLAASVEIRNARDLEETFFQGFIRGFFGSNPLVAFVVLDGQVKEDDARLVAASIKLLNRCAEKGGVRDPNLKTLAEKSAAFAQTDTVVISKRGRDGPFVPLIMFADPVTASKYADILADVLTSKELIVARRSQVADEVRRKFEVWSGRRVDARTVANQIGELVMPTCTPSV
jgi:hypothetical protein